MPIRHSRVGTKFRLKMTLLNFWIKLTQKGYFLTKKKKNYHRIQHIQILDSKFQLQQKVLIFGTNYQKKYISRKHKKRTSLQFFIFELPILSTAFQLKLTITIFQTKLAKKGSYFQSKTDKIDNIIEFCIFELVFVSNFTLNKQF